MLCFLPRLRQPERWIGGTEKKIQIKCVSVKQSNKLKTYHVKTPHLLKLSPI